MSNPSPLPQSYSPTNDQPPRSAFQWPAPLSPRFEQDDHHNDTTATNTDIPLKDILEKYKDDADILQHILMAKAEEDKKQAARDMLKTEQARIHLKQLDLEYLREQSRWARYYDKPYHHPSHSHHPPPPPHHYTHQQQQHHVSTEPTVRHQPSTIMGTSLPPPTVTPHPPLSSTATAGSPYGYNLAPVQQQVLARFNGGGQSQASHYDYQPSSPVAYPHSAHPLCPPPDLRNKNSASASSTSSSLSSSRHHPSNASLSTSIIPTSSSNSNSSSSTRHYHHRLQPPSINTSTATTTVQPSTPISPAIGNGNANYDDLPTSATPRCKRTRPLSTSADPSDDKLSHNKVMEALKAKIQRGNGSPVSATPPSSAFRPATSLADSAMVVHMDKRQRQLPKPIMTLDNNNKNNNGSSTSSSSTSSSSSTTVVTGTGTTNGPILPSSSSPSNHTPSPRSAKPILPPIDTSVGQHHHHHHHHQHHHSSPAIKTDHVSPSDPLLPMSAHHRSSSSRSTPPYEQASGSRIKLEAD
ncbi:hypothetical protein BCR42DRAFT_429303 [Absidia repens]|uniref:Uncharacterized protein n=1 Tax=Absidia repens TaxID=90262 RepID=A0A1X2HYM2_9FUNG|nr:hypothetical protein BCR42DRAFT_429303 [Absidia repens]